MSLEENFYTGVNKLKKLSLKKVERAQRELSHNDSREVVESSLDGGMGKIC